MKYSGEQLHGRTSPANRFGQRPYTEQDLRNVWQLIQATASEDAA